MVSKRDEFNYLPEGLPEPKDDGACNHLLGMTMPSAKLRSTSGKLVDPSKTDTKYVVIFVYPITGSSTNQLLLEYEEEWNNTPGACGCTSQICGYRDLFSDLKELGTTVYGLSNNSPEYQKEAADRLEINYQLLSDENMDFAKALNLPTFIFRDWKLLKRVTLVFKDNKIVKVFYPIFPPSENASEVIAWIEDNQ